MTQRVYILSDYERGLIVEALKTVTTGNALDTTHSRDLARVIAHSPSVEVIEVVETDDERQAPLPWHR
jgi:hypothetical protein